MFYALVLDAGSSGSRLRVFRWEEATDSQLPPIREISQDSAHARHQAECLRRRPGLSAFARSPALAGKQVSDLVDCAARMVPEEFHKRTPLYVKATAGLRLVKPAMAEAVLEAVRGALAAGPFDFRGAQIISGEAEAIFGWLSVNHLHATLSAPPQAPSRVGWLDLGGASAQISFELPRDATVGAGDEAFVEELALPSGATRVYRRSRLSYGREAAFKRTCRMLRDERLVALERRRSRRRRAQAVDNPTGEGADGALAGGIVDGLSLIHI